LEAENDLRGRDGLFGGAPVVTGFGGELLVGRDDTLRSVNGSIPRGGGGDTAISGGVTRVAETQNLETKSPADQNATPENGGYEYVIIFDADFDPHPGFIRKVRVGPFQTPNQKTDCLRVQH
jgi:hypothetical protein